MPHILRRNWRVICLTAIVLVGFILRVWQLEKIPAILNRDEAALAYNALLLKETGHDEWQQMWPLALKSFGDYKLPGYPMMLVGMFSILGYADWVVRLPSALAGTALIFISALWITHVLKIEKKFAVWGAVLVALQPVFFFYSRIAFEANVALSIFTLSISLLFIKSEKWLKDVIAIFLLLVAIFVYNTPLLLLPFLLPLLIWWRGWKKPKRWLPAVIGMALVIGIGITSFMNVSQQKSGITIFSDESIWQQSVLYHQQFTGITQKILGNRIVFFAQLMAERYIATFSPSFLVMRGGTHPWHTLPGFGHLYWSTYLFGWIGIIFFLITLLKKLRRLKRISFADIHQELLILALLFIAPLPAVITVDAPHATRSLLFFWVWMTWAVIGLREFVLHLRLSRIKHIVWGVAIVVLLIESGNYLHEYFGKYETESTAILRGGYGSVITQVLSQHPSEHIAVVDDAGYLYIITAWYLQLPPAQFFNTIHRHLPDKIGFTYGYKLLNMRFVKSPNDAFADEKIIVEWEPSASQWQVKEKN